MTVIKQPKRRTILVLVSAALCLGVAPAGAESLYNEGSFRPLAGDNKAYRVGDVLTVQVFENSSAQTSADTNTRRRNELSASLTLSNGSAKTLGVSTSGEFDGGGHTQRANRLLATLTVSVQEILPNGDLRVAGQQLLTVDDEQQKVNLEGRVRPQDITDSNIVLSTRLADAKITYVGDGELSERQKRSWWRKMLDALGF